MSVPAVVRAARNAQPGGAMWASTIEGGIKEVGCARNSGEEALSFDRKAKTTR